VIFDYPAILLPPMVEVVGKKGMTKEEKEAAAETAAEKAAAKKAAEEAKAAKIERELFEVHVEKMYGPQPEAADAGGGAKGKGKGKGKDEVPRDEVLHHLDNGEYEARWASVRGPLGPLPSEIADAVFDVRVIQGEYGAAKGKGKGGDAEGAEVCPEEVIFQKRCTVVGGANVVLCKHPTTYYVDARLNWTYSRFEGNVVPASMEAQLVTHSDGNLAFAVDETEAKRREALIASWSASDKNRPEAAEALRRKFTSKPGRPELHDKEWEDPLPEGEEEEGVVETPKKDKKADKGKKAAPKKSGSKGAVEVPDFAKLVGLGLTKEAMVVQVREGAEAQVLSAEEIEALVQEVEGERERQAEWATRIQEVREQGKVDRKELLGKVGQETAEWWGGEVASMKALLEAQAECVARKEAEEAAAAAT